MSACNFANLSFFIENVLHFLEYYSFSLSSILLLLFVCGSTFEALGGGVGGIFVNCVAGFSFFYFFIYLMRSSLFPTIINFSSNSKRKKNH